MRSSATRCARRSAATAGGWGGGGAAAARLPARVPGPTMTRLCASGLDAVGTAARAIRLGELDLVIAGGVESMSRAPLVMGKAEAAVPRSAASHDTTIASRGR